MSKKDNKTKSSTKKDDEEVKPLMDDTKLKEL